MGKFRRMIGKLDFKIQGEDITITPQVGDGTKLFKIMENPKEEGKYDKLKDFIESLLFREYPEEDKDEIKLMIEFYINTFIKEILIGFNWINREKWESTEKEQTKKLIEGN